MEDYHRGYILQHALEGSGLRDIADEIKTITPAEAMEDYEKLRGLKCGAINTKSVVGNKAMDIFFFKHRLATKSKGGDSFYDWVRGNPLKTPSAKRLYKYNLEHGKSPAVAKYDVFRLYKGSINAFKPIIARDLYCRFNPKTILDFSAGWGGRCLGAMSLDINYIGFDTNTSLRKAYESMVKTYPHKSKVVIRFQDSSKVDYSKYTYDFVFTSPPYYQKTNPTEGYENMPHYENREDFNERFFFPVVRNTMRNLSAGGHYALNIPMDMYEDVKKVLGACDTKMPLYIQKRYAGQEGGYKEFIYVWKKKALTGGGLPTPTFKSKLVEIKPSKVAGVGVFAKEDLPAEKRLGSYSGVKMSNEAFKKKYGNDTRYTYNLNLYPIASGMLVGKDEPYLSRNISHYINEGDPNVKLRARALWASRPIKKGEELFLQYPDNYPRNWK